MSPEVTFFEGVVAFCAMARRKAKDPKEARAAANLEIELGERIKAIKAAERQAEYPLNTDNFAGPKNPAIDEAGPAGGVVSPAGLAATVS